MKKLLSVILFASAISLIQAQEIAVIKSDLQPEQDGVINTNEYSSETKIQKALLYFSVSKDGSTLYAAIKAETKGYVALGLNASRMDGAVMNLGFDDLKTTSGKVITVLGSLHFHGDKVSDTILKKVVKEINGNTTLEIAIDIKKAKITIPSTIKFIYAIGLKDDLVSKHVSRASGSLSIK